jgi:hypothetical protein
MATQLPLFPEKIALIRIRPDKNEREGVNQMKLLSLVCAAGALGTGLIAAVVWYRASQIEIDLGYDYAGAPPTYKRGGIEFRRVPESGDPHLQQMNEIAATSII